MKIILRNWRYIGKERIYNPRFVTLSKFEYDRIGSGHGMYTETFHTMDMKTGEELSNEDIIIPKSEEKVKELLYVTGN